MYSKQFTIVLLFMLFALTTCGSQPGPAIETTMPDSPIEPPETSEPVPTLVAEETLPIAETAGPDCLGGVINPIGKSIADEYESASYEQVMTWFCNGAEFEDILVALETEAQTDTSADEMLKMLADGFTWNEIWQLIGLTD